MAEQQAGSSRAGRGGRWRGTTVLLVGSLGLATLAILIVAGISYLSTARAARPPVHPRPGGIYLMTEGALEMEMLPLSGTAPSKAELARVAGIVRQARLVAARYGDLRTAIADGYQTAPDLLVDTQGQHYFQAQYLDQASTGIFAAAQPPFLVYNTLQGRTALSGLLYYMPAAATPRQLAAIFPPSLAGWHRHINVCISGGTSLLDGTAILPIHDRATCLARGGAFIARTGWMVHLWLDQPLGTSLFAMDRPQP